MMVLLRWSLTVALLVTIARHAHWSVTLAFALISVHTEVVTYLIVKLRRQVSPPDWAEVFRRARRPKKPPS